MSLLFDQNLSRRLVGLLSCFSISLIRHGTRMGCALDDVGIIMAQEVPDPKLPGSPRTARQWLHDFGWNLPEPSAQDLSDLDRVMEHDEFWEWSSGKVEMPAVVGNTHWRQTFRDLAILGLIYGGLFVVLATIQWFMHG